VPQGRPGRGRIIVLLMSLGLFAVPALRAAPAAPCEACVAPHSGLEPDVFLHTWLILSPIPIGGTAQNPPDEHTQAKAFAADLLTGNGGEATVRPRAGLEERIGGRQLEWRRVESPRDAVDLKAGDDPETYVVAYAATEIDVPRATRALLGIGSDDGVKVWLNGKLVHERWAIRPVHPDEDVVPVQFVRGRNRLLLKVQNASDGWGFTCRVMGAKAQGDKLAEAVRRADRDAVGHWLDLGMKVNGHDALGLTALQLARLTGQTDMVSYLARRGATLTVPIPAPGDVVDKLFSHVIDRDGPGAAVLVARDGQILFERGYGLADIESHVPVTPATSFRIGSITKQFTTAAILKLQEQGKLSVTDTLSKYIADFPRGGEVTLHHLLTHTSGIHSYTDKPEFVAAVTHPVKPLEVIQSIKSDPYDFGPGQQWRYDNSGYFLLGYIVETVSGESYGDFLRKSFFDPLGMTHTGVYHNDHRPEREALGYESDPKAPLKYARAPDWDMTWAAGAGALSSTVEDLYRWNEALFGGKVLAPASMEAAFTSGRIADGSQTGYGYGWFVATLRGEQMISHGGGLPGFRSYLSRLPREHFTVVVLMNGPMSTYEGNPTALAQAVTEAYLSAELPPRPVAVTGIAPHVLDSIVGQYDYGPQGIMSLTREGDRLFAQLPGQPRLEIFPRSDHEFFWKAVEAEVTFISDANGKVIEAIHHQNGGTRHAPRVAELTEVAVDPSSYDALTGKYDFGQGKAILTVTRDGAHLFAQLTNQPKFEIFPKSPDEFFWKVVNAQITFVKDERGKVTKAIHHQNGRTLEAPRID
jgi:CubicO group peptidase (beta-lactamase class C family)